MGELELTGEYAARSRRLPRHERRVEARRRPGAYTCAATSAGTILDDLIVYRAAQDRWLIVCNASNREKMAAHFAKAAEDHCEFDDRSDETALIALQGPKAFDDPRPAPAPTRATLRELKSFHFRDAVVGNVALHRRAHRLHGRGRRRDLLRLERRACSSGTRCSTLGAPFGIKPAGLGARDTLRLEARLSLYGNDIDETTNPIEAGPRLGREARQGRVRRHGGARGGQGRAASPASSSASRSTGRGIARHGYPLRDVDGKEVGICTSGSPGPTVGKNIGLGYLPAAMAQIGTKFLVDCRGKNIEAVVVKTPFYKRASS